MGFNERQSLAFQIAGNRCRPWRICSGAFYPSAGKRDHLPEVWNGAGGKGEGRGIICMY